MDASATEPARPAANEARSRVSDILETISQASIQSINELKNSIKLSVLRLAVDLLQRAASICVIGSDEAFPVAVLLAQGLRERGCDCSVHDLSASGAEASAKRELTRYGRSDLLIVVRMSGSRLPVGALAGARRRGVRILAITDSAVDSRVRDADVVLSAPPTRIYGMLNLSGCMTVTQLLLIALDRSAK